MRGPAPVSIRRSLAIAVVLGFLRPSPAQAADGPPAPAEAAQAAVAAAADPKALADLARRDNPDPWLVADELLAGGKADVAEAFAKAAPRKDVEALPAYVAAARARPVAPARREALARGLAALAAGENAKALALASAAEVSAGDLVAARVLHLRGKSAQELRQFVESAKAYDEASAVATRLGWLAGAAAALDQGTRSRARRSDFAGALETAGRWEALEASLGCTQGVARAVWQQGGARASTGRYDEARTLLTRALGLAEKAGDFECQANVLLGLAMLEEVASRRPEAVRLAQDGLDRLAKAGGPAALARYEPDPRLLVQTRAVLYIQQATSTYRMGDAAGARALLEKGREAAEQGGSPQWAALAMMNAGQFRQNDGDPLGAIDLYEKAVALYRRAGDRAGEAGALRRVGRARTLIGDHDASVQSLRQALDLQVAVDDRREAALTRRALAYALSDDAELPAAREQAGAALQAAREMGDKEIEAYAWQQVGILASRGGDFGVALSALERSVDVFRSVGLHAEAARSTYELGALDERIGDRDKARQSYEEARASAEQGKAPGTEGRALLALGVSWLEEGETAKAKTAIESAIPRLAAGREADGTLGAQRVLARVRLLEGDPAGAADLCRKVLQAGAAAREGSLQVLFARLDLAQALVAGGDDAQARRVLDEGLAGADGAADVDAAARCRWSLAILDEHEGRHDEAIANARAALTTLDTLGRDLAEGEGSLARATYAPVARVGAAAAFAKGAAGDLFYFLESDRARTLLQALGGRDVLRTEAVPEALRREEAQARGAEAVARAKHALALQGGERAAILAARRDLDAARERVKDVVARIQREARARADVVRPVPATLEQVRAALRPGEAMVLYGALEKDVVALVIEPGGARAVSIGPRAAVEKACDDLVTDDEPHCHVEAIPAARKALVEPLGLGKDVRRLLVSPTGRVSYVPMALLAGDRQVAMVPSASVYAMLSAIQSPSGSGVLALGDPDYSIGGTAPGASGLPGGREPLALSRSGFMLVPLPATRREAEAVGTAVLLGPQASETGFRTAIAQDRRWRAIHIACHGIVDPEHPTLSGLALGADASNDGFLTAMDVFELNIRADLVALSACDTARGTLVEGEGVIGFVRAFLFAGPPRVLASLWKVDDEATSYLMQTFYGLWNPKDGSKGIPPAEALARAQAAVRAQEKWKAPDYWAAWQLWGLPE